MTPVVRPDHWLTCSDVQDWHDWLAENHSQAKEIWLQIRKAGADATETPGVLLKEAVTEAIRFGWIDSRVYSLGERGFILRFTPRKPSSYWSMANRKVAESMIAESSMSPAGLAAVQAGLASGKWQTAYASNEQQILPDDITAALQADPAVWDTFILWAPSLKMQHILWIEAAKRPETRRKRINALIEKIRTP